MQVLISALQSSDLLHFGLFVRDFLILRYDVRLLSIDLQIRGIHFVEPFFEDIYRDLNFF
jgi:hypothetical protein